MMRRKLGQRLEAIFRAQCGVMILVLGAALALPAVCSGAELRYTNINDVRYVFLEDVADFYGLAFRRRSDGVVLSSRWSGLHFEKDKRQARINDVTVHLSHAPAKWHGQPMVSRPDFLYMIDPLLRPSLNQRAAEKHVVLDPGHGGKDKGAEGTQVVEKELVLDVAEKAAHSLRKEGYEVSLTHNGDKKLPLAQRPRLAKKRGADLFISIHANHAADESASGIETFILPPHGTAPTYNNRALTKRRSAHRFSRSNACLGYSLQQYTVETTQATDRGLKHANFSVLRNASTPAALLEVGFLSNPSEEKRLRKDSYRRKLAQGITRGVSRYYQRVNRGK